MLRGSRRTWLVPVGLMALALLLTLLDAGPVRAGDGNLLDSAVNTVLEPLQATSTVTSNGLVRWWTNLWHLGSVGEENDRLRTTVETLEKENKRLRSLEEENRRLRELLGLSNDLTRLKWTTLAARVIARDPTNWFDTLTLDVGQKDRVTKGMVVIASTGLVGQIAYAAWNTSRVRLVTDTRSSVPCLVDRSHAVGVVYGQDGPTCEVRYLDPEASIREGDEIVTSGLGSIFPPGLVLGKVVSITGMTDVMFKTAKVRPSARFDRLTEALVLVDHQP